MSKLTIIQERAIPTPEADKVIHSIKGLRNNNQKAALMCINPYTVADLLEHLQRLESYDLDEPVAGPSKEVEFAKTSQDLSNLCTNLTSRTNDGAISGNYTGTQNRTPQAPPLSGANLSLVNQNRTPRRDITEIICFRYGKMGQFARDCNEQPPVIN